MVGNGLKFFVTGRDLEWAGVKDGDDLFSYVRFALRLFSAVPREEPHFEPPEVAIEIVRNAPERGWDVSVTSTTLSLGYAKVVAVDFQPSIDRVDYKGTDFVIEGHLKAVPKA